MTLAAKKTQGQDSASETGSFFDLVNDYNARLNQTLTEFDWSPVESLAQELISCWKSGRRVFICGNGGSGANAIHIANDFIYGISKTYASGLNITALPANSAVVTCLGNDVGYENIFSYQLAVMAQKDDVLIVLSGSGNSPNIIQALDTATALGMKTFGILGYSGGKAKAKVGTAIHFEIDDMEVSEDIQMIVANILKRWLSRYQAEVTPRLPSAS